MKTQFVGCFYFLGTQHHFWQDQTIVIAKARTWTTVMAVAIEQNRNCVCAHKHVTFFFFFLKILLIFRVRDGRGREGEKPQWARDRLITYLSHAPKWGTSLHPRNVPRSGIEPATFWFAGRHPIYLATPASTKLLIFIMGTLSQDGSIGKRVTPLLPQPHQNYNWTTEQPSFRTIWNLLEWNSYNWGNKKRRHIQTSRRDGDAECLVPLAWGISELQRLPLRSEESSPTSGPCTLVECQEEKSP